MLLDIQEEMFVVWISLECREEVGDGGIYEEVNDLQMDLRLLDSMRGSGVWVWRVKKRSWRFEFWESLLEVFRSVRLERGCY